MSSYLKKYRFQKALNLVDFALDELQIIDCHLMKHCSRNQRTSAYSSMEDLMLVKQKLEKIVNSIRTKPDYVPMNEPVDGIDDLDESIPF